MDKVKFVNEKLLIFKKDWSRIARLANVSRPTINNFIEGKGSTLKTLDKLFICLKKYKEREK